MLYVDSVPETEKVKVNPEALRALIQKDGYGIAGFARDIGMAPSHLSNILAKRRGCTPAYVKKMAEVLKVPQSALLWYERDVA